MRDVVLLGCGHLGKRSSITIVGDEQAVISEPSVASLAISDGSLAAAFHRQLRTVWEGDGHDRSEPRTTIGYSIKLDEKMPTIGLVVGLLPCEACRAHTRCAVKGIDLEAGVVCESRLDSRRTDCPCLQQGISFQRLGIFDHIGHLWWAWDEFNHSSQERGHLCNLAGIRRGTDKSRSQPVAHVRAGGGTAVISS